MGNGVEPGLLKWFADNVWVGIVALTAVVWMFLRADAGGADRRAGVCASQHIIERLR